MTTRTSARRSPRGVLAAAALALVSVVVLAGCVQRESEAGIDQPDRVDADSLGDLVLQVGDQRGGTEALLRASGKLDDVPYEIEFSTFTSGPPMVEAANAGQIDFAVTGNTPPVFGIAADARLRVVSAYGNHGAGDKLLVPDDSDIGDVADLEGRSIAVGRGTSAHGNLLLQLTEVGLAPEDVEMVFLQPAEAQAAFDRGDVDAWAIWDPYTAIAETESEVRTIATAEGVSNGLWFGLASIDAIEDERRTTAIADLLERLAEAGTWSSQNTDDWAEAYAAEIGISSEAATVSADRSTRVPRPLPETYDTQQNLADAFIDAGELQGTVDFRGHADERYVDDLADVVEPLP